MSSVILCEGVTDKYGNDCPDSAAFTSNKTLPIDIIDDAVEAGWSLGGCNMYLRCPKCTEQARKEGLIR